MRSRSARCAADRSRAPAGPSNGSSPFVSFPGAFDRDELEQAYKNFLIETVSAIAPTPAVPTRRLREMIYAYPTFHRAVEDALRAL